MVQHSPSTPELLHSTQHEPLPFMSSLEVPPEIVYLVCLVSSLWGCSLSPGVDLLLQKGHWDGKHRSILETSRGAGALDRGYSSEKVRAEPPRSLPAPQIPARSAGRALCCCVLLQAALASGRLALPAHLYLDGSGHALTSLQTLCTVVFFWHRALCCGDEIK